MEEPEGSSWADWAREADRETAAQTSRRPPEHATSVDLDVRLRWPNEQGAERYHEPPPLAPAWADTTTNADGGGLVGRLIEDVGSLHRLVAESADRFEQALAYLQDQVDSQAVRIDETLAKTSSRAASEDGPQLADIGVVISESVDRLEDTLADVRMRIDHQAEQLEALQSDLAKLAPTGLREGLSLARAVEGLRETLESVERDLALVRKRIPVQARPAGPVIDVDALAERIVTALSERFEVVEDVSPEPSPIDFAPTEEASSAEAPSASESRQQPLRGRRPRRAR